MILIIPSIPIVHGVCGGQIASLAHEVHHADGEIYSHDPIDRARLLRKENAKMLHLEFLDRDAWDDSCLRLIHNIREAVDIPIGVSVAEVPASENQCRQLFDAGIYRIFLPLGTPEAMFLQYCKQFTSRKIIPKVDLTYEFETKLPLYRSMGVERIGIDISKSDRLESGTIEWARLQRAAKIAGELGIRITALHGVRGYPELRELQDLHVALDSLILCRALNENRFPCQLIWREMEATSALESTPASNLWSNPLAGKPHI